MILKVRRWRWSVLYAGQLSRTTMVAGCWLKQLGKVRLRSWCRLHGPGSRASYWTLGVFLHHRVAWHHTGLTVLLSANYRWLIFCRRSFLRACREHMLPASTPPPVREARVQYCLLASAYVTLAWWVVVGGVARKLREMVCNSAALSTQCADFLMGRSHH